MTKQEQLKAIQEKRRNKVSAYDEVVKERRLDSELKLAEVEERTGKTLGIDLAAVFLPDGRLIAVGKCPAVIYNKWSLAVANQKLSDELCSELSAAVIEYPKAGDGDLPEKMFLDFPNARDAVINGATSLVAVDQSNMLGK